MAQCTSHMSSIDFKIYSIKSLAQLSMSSFAEINGKNITIALVAEHMAVIIVHAEVRG